ncbi:MAG: PEGA domain-containing protein [Planctomycetota bacterium]
MRAFVTILAAALFCGGCAQRILRIETEPSGALVFMDNREIGRTPIEMPFVYGGVREFLILKDERGPGPDQGPMKPLIVRQEVENFYFDTFPFDLFVELSPVAITDVHEFHFVLEPSDTLASYEVDPDAYSDALKDRALEMSARAREALEEGFPGSLPRQENKDSKEPATDEETSATSKP